jgi:hypothetical protein
LLQRSHLVDWQCATPAIGLPPPLWLGEQLDVGAGRQQALLLEDDLLLPQKVPAEGKVESRDLPAWLLWKTRRFLPFPHEQAAQRHRAFAKGWLVLSLPKPWVETLVQTAADRGIHLGFIGGIFDWLSQETGCRGTTLLCLFRDFWILADLDDSGALLDYRLRRLPRDASGELDSEAMLEVDAAGAARGRDSGKAARLFSLDPLLDGHLPELEKGLRDNFPGLQTLQLTGNLPQRLAQLGCL